MDEIKTLDGVNMSSTEIEVQATAGSNALSKAKEEKKARKLRDKLKQYKLYVMFLLAVLLVIARIGLAAINDYIVPLFGESVFIFLDKILEEGSIALLIAVFIVWLIEEASHDAIRETIESRIVDCAAMPKKIFDAVDGKCKSLFCEAFKSNMPNVVMETAMCDIFTKKFYRHNHHINWHMQLEKDSTGHWRLRVRSTDSYLIENITDNDEEFTFEYAVEKAALPKPNTPREGINYIRIGTSQKDLSKLVFG